MPVVVQNESPITFPTDVKISVLNKNPEKSVLRWDGTDWEFPPGEATIIPCDAAHEIFAVETRTPPGHVVKIRRDPDAGRTGTDVSDYDRCKLKYGAANSAKGEAWFQNFEFKLVKSTKKMTKEEWDRLK